MIQVIRHGNKKRIVCPDCSCLFTYQKEDVRHKQTGVNEFEGFVRCPYLVLSDNKGEKK